MATKYEMIYSQIKANIDELMNIYEYKNESIAFGHLMLKYIFNISNDEAYESMTDGAINKLFDISHIFQNLIDV